MQDDFMERIKIKLENCYGIRNLETEFDFSAEKMFVIYAPNGTMKTSFSATMRDFANDQPPVDRVYKNRVSKREIVIAASGQELEKEKVFVIQSFDEKYESSRISTLLVNEALKKEYDEIYRIIDEKKKILLDSLKESSGIKKNIEDLFAMDIVQAPHEFFKALLRVKEEVKDDSYVEFAEISYESVFNDKVQELLDAKDFKENLADYMKTYEALIKGSTFFKRGVLNHNNAADIAKSLKDNGYFKANHSVYINTSDGKKEIATETELEKAIQKEKDGILKNPELVKSFEKIDKKFKNKDTKSFRDYLDQNNAILVELNNLALFKQKLWIAYLVKNKQAYEDLVKFYDQSKMKLQEIVKKASEEATKWQEVINIFNERFEVPFKVEMGNKTDVILKRDAPSISFRFKDPEETDILIEKNDLWTVLSNGEKRALYILNIIFEVKAREELNQETIFIIDDIADSFDYKNKYAIIEYLSDIARRDGFYQIILTHNYDFYRNVTSRLHVPQSARFYVSVYKKRINIIPERYPYNPFRTWKQNLHQDNEMLIATIPFLRNLAEFCGHTDHKNTLTKLLHIKSGTDDICVTNLQVIIRDLLVDKRELSLRDGSRKVKELIYECADAICENEKEVIELEKKIVLSMAIRLKTEQFLIREINDELFVSEITHNQTITLIKKYKEINPDSTDDKLRIAERVNLMTPENIHINSFMYEPILDMSSHHLRELYKQVTEMERPRQLLEDAAENAEANL
jgi:energy-coupling factor transporter ATP-binding protein EcfA2